MSEALMKFETIEQMQIEDIMNDKEPRLPDDWENSDESNEDNDQTPNLGDHVTQH